MLKIDDTAPEFCIPNQDEVEICLRDLAGKWIILYFYPKDNTPGCTTEACDFSSDNEHFEDLNGVILGVSPDSPKSHKKFIENKSLEITLLSDEDKKICEAYGVWQMKKFMGREFMGVVRTTFIIDPAGKIAAVFENVNVRKTKSVKGEKIQILHSDMVKETLIKLQGEY